MMTLFIDQDCIHCRSVINLLTSKGISFNTETLDGDEYDVPIITDGGFTYVGFNDCLNYISNL